MLLLAAYLAVMPRASLVGHSPFNHYALQAQAWLDGRLDLGGPPPPYTMNNDFALYEGKHYVSFPPFPALLILPVVAAAGSVERVRDAQFFLWFAPLAPALLFLTLDKLRRRSGRKSWQNLALALSFGLGTVYWFSAVQGTVWFAGHVVGTGLLCAFLYASIDAEHPFLAGLLLACAVATRPSLAFALPVFGYELWRTRHRGAWWSKGIRFAAPLAFVGMLLMGHNQVRFGDPTEFGHRLLQVRWRTRIDKWGLFSTHYLGRNLAVMLTGLPYFSEGKGLQINGHGLALWLTTPIYGWALWPRLRNARARGLFAAVAVSAGAVALPSLLYQNTGWLQFGYRFSNDFAPLLFVMIALGGRRFSLPFWLLAAFGIAVNGFGAVTFGKTAYQRYYAIDGSQRTLHQPD